MCFHICVALYLFITLFLLTFVQLQITANAVSFQLNEYMMILNREKNAIFNYETSRLNILFMLLGIFNIFIG